MREERESTDAGRGDRRYALLLAQVHVAHPATKVDNVPFFPLCHRVRRVKNELVTSSASWHELSQMCTSVRVWENLSALVRREESVSAAACVRVSVLEKTVESVH